MKEMLTRVFWPILSFFETGEEPENYKKSHRVALNILGTLFLTLSLGSVVVGYSSGQPGAIIPAVVFFCVGLVAIVLGGLGSKRAVSRIWGVK
ncbi:hypothetical protein BWR19_11205 [Halomonas sp. 1513]|nr:hypothetical protein [Halomonas sp. 1513]APX93452.1 hypothetical protein BWR19_11205 [Halomonas sp. 1513]